MNGEKEEKREKTMLCGESMISDVNAQNRRKQRVLRVMSLSFPRPTRHIQNRLPQSCHFFFSIFSFFLITKFFNFYKQKK